MVSIRSNSYQGVVSRVGKLSLDELRNLDPAQCGLKGNADFLLYELISENDLGYEEFHARVDGRVITALRRKPRDYLRVYQHEYTGDPKREAAIRHEVDAIVESEFTTEIQHITNYWRQRGTL